MVAKIWRFAVLEAKTGERGDHIITHAAEGRPIVCTNVANGSSFDPHVTQGTLDIDRLAITFDATLKEGDSAYRVRTVFDFVDGVGVAIEL